MQDDARTEVLLENMSIDEKVFKNTFRDVMSALVELNEGLETELPTVTESFFRAHILPDLAGTSGDPTLSKWMGIACHPGRSINVMTDDNKELLFKVPPLLGFNTARYAKVGRDSYKNILDRYSHMITVIPHKAVNDLAIELEATTPKMDSDPVLVAHLDWIFRRYGYPPLLPDEVALDAAPTGSESGQSNIPTPTAFEPI